ncbi:SufS family cysteine desulfurase [Lactobacillus jensenii]|uniref:Cysteine desulfurase n=1 Tax=Lactobacillus jensenii TaxID=109790 RepID=A0A5N1ID80_LACJE|nr:SufS family cysteine desulfurase [Lactobacillus jensenii]EEQ24911.1 cysteine desulfurase, SufS subfamily [Lactobacillus jensenii 269-3]APT14529.1 cysteine sulfinate desulfinase [Lactobacillus jensenii]EEX27900.1 cysteine desulfurase, SufS subfamily [Lactobacillus jensenii SJ-7A-US]KAA9237047.1 SufS family cysteine desulfurase [Lactobacillus jensenii]KAA9260098.1 SufS family cysteine desulfurase [Lactobacillus jensenii]
MRERSVKNNYKADFPLLANSDLIYLDSAATSQKPQCVIDALTNYYQTQNANVHRALYGLGEAATAEYEQARKKVAGFINSEADEVIFTKGTTQGLNWIANGFAEQVLKPGDEILISIEEHHSNLVPWQIIAQKTGAKLVYVYLTADLNFDYADFEVKLNSKTKIVALHHMSNVLGNILDISKLAELTHNFGAYLVVDGAQAAAHTVLDMKKFDCDFYAFSGHKMFGPMGIGVLFGKRELLAKMQPVEYGGEMINEVSEQSADFKAAPLKFEAGTQNVAGAIGLGVAIDYLKQVGITNIEKVDLDLSKYAKNKLEEIDGITIYGHNHGIISFNLDGVHPHDVASFLDADDLCLRAGHHCAEPLMNYLKIPACLRASFSIYNDYSDVDALANSLKKIKEFFGK